VVRAGALVPGRLHGPPFSAPHSSWGLGLDGLGAAGPNLKQTKSAERLALKKENKKMAAAGASA
jgi:hypothetical protein